MGKSIVVVGSLNADLVLRMPRFPRAGETLRGSEASRYPGGKGANQACAAARLAPPGLDVRMLGQVGGDDFGTWLRDGLGAAGADVSGVLVDRETTSGLAVISVEDSGQNQIVLVPGANDTFRPDRLAPLFPAIDGAALVLLQLETPLETVLAAARRARAAGALVILDPAPPRPLPDELVALCDILTPNETELAIIAEGPALAPGAPVDRAAARAGAERLRRRGARTVIVKLGAAGALAVGPDGEQAFAPFPVRAVDTAAAGDAFNGALAVALAEGHPLAEAGRFACAAAALSVTRAGAQTSLPSRAEALTFAARGPAAGPRAAC